MPEDTKAGLIQSFLDNYNGTQVCSKLIYAEAPVSYTHLDVYKRQQYIMVKLDLKLHPVKTKIVSMWDGKERCV